MSFLQGRRRKEFQILKNKGDEEEKFFRRGDDA
jgi:hypothetical protein